MSKRLRSLVFLALSSAAPLAAHDLWLAPSTFHPQRGELVRVHVKVGDDPTQAEPVVRDSGKLIRLSVFEGAGTEAPLPGIDGQDPAGLWRPAAAGPAILIYESSPRPIELPAERFEHYLEEEGLEAIVAERARRGESAAAGRELYSRSVKALVEVGDGPPRDRAVGLPLELVLEGPLARQITARLLWQGQPAENALVEAVAVEGETLRVRGRTDAAGRVRLELPRDGRWILATVHMERAKPGQDADWRSTWSSLSFELSPPPAAPAPATVATFEESIEVQERADSMVGAADSAGEGFTGRPDLRRRPILRQGELLETVPGVVITQHSGSGKANQYFLRGFNLDHGTDFRVTVDGVPVNLPSHGHGQGYADLGFLIPELISSVHYRKGPYSAEDGDFAAAGAAHLTTVDQLDQGLVVAEPGSYGYGRLLAADSRPLGTGRLLGAVEYARSDGAWDHPEGYHRANTLVRYSQGSAEAGFALTFSGYDARWDSTDQIPLRAVADGRLDRFGTIDPSDGGASDRYSLVAEGHRGDERSLSQWRAYGVRYGLELFSNFTYFLDDPVAGDQFEQRDERWIGGLSLGHQRLASWQGHSYELDSGVDLRYDDIDNGLFATTARVRRSTTRQDRIRQVTGGPWAELRFRPARWLRAIPGVRADGYAVDVTSDLAANSGTRQAAILSPKLSLVAGPWKDAELYLNLGGGFHSNDARGATIRVDPETGEAATAVPPLVRARGIDFGVRSERIAGLHTAVTAFQLDLDSELVFVGDAGGTEAGRPSRRRGIEWTNAYRHGRFSADLDLSLSRSRFTDEDPAGDHVPGAIETVITGGVALSDVGPWSASLRVRHFGPRPLLEDASVRSGSSTLVSTRVDHRFRAGVVVSLEVFNLLDRKVDDITYFYASRLPGEPDDGVEDRHFHPTERRNVRVGLGWRW